MILRYDNSFFGADEILAKQNKDGTYHVTLKTVAKEEGTDEEIDIVVEVPRSRVSIEALASNDTERTMYTVTQVEKSISESELPEHTPSTADWRMLGYDLSELPRLVSQ